MMEYKMIVHTYTMSEKEPNSITGPETLHEAVKESFSDSEEMHILVVDCKNRVIKRVMVAMGSSNSVMVEPADLFRKVLMSGGSRFAVAHTHPSGDLNPSENDISFTRKVEKGAKLLGLTILDHLIYTSKEFYSFKKEGLM